MVDRDSRVMTSKISLGISSINFDEKVQAISHCCHLFTPVETWKNIPNQSDEDGILLVADFLIDSVFKSRKSTFVNSYSALLAFARIYKFRPDRLSQMFDQRFNDLTSKKSFNPDYMYLRKCMVNYVIMQLVVDISRNEFKILFGNKILENVDISVQFPELDDLCSKIICDCIRSDQSVFDLNNSNIISCIPTKISNWNRTHFCLSLILTMMLPEAVNSTIKLELDTLTRKNVSIYSDIKRLFSTPPSCELQTIWNLSLEYFLQKSPSEFITFWKDFVKVHTREISNQSLENGFQYFINIVLCVFSLNLTECHIQTVMDSFFLQTILNINTKTASICSNWKKLLIFFHEKPNARSGPYFQIAIQKLLQNMYEISNTVLTSIMIGEILDLVSKASTDVLVSSLDQFSSGINDHDGQEKFPKMNLSVLNLIFRMSRHDKFREKPEFLFAILHIFVSFGWFIDDQDIESDNVDGSRSISIQCRKYFFQSLNSILKSSKNSVDTFKNVIKVFELNLKNFSSTHKNENTIRNIHEAFKVLKKTEKLLCNNQDSEITEPLKLFVFITFIIKLPENREENDLVNCCQEVIVCVKQALLPKQKQKPEIHWFDVLSEMLISYLSFPHQWIRQVTRDVYTPLSLENFRLSTWKLFLEVISGDDNIITTTEEDTLSESLNSSFEENDIDIVSEEEEEMDLEENPRVATNQTSSESNQTDDFDLSSVPLEEAKPDDLEQLNTILASVVKMNVDKKNAKVQEKRKIRTVNEYKAKVADLLLVPFLTDKKQKSSPIASNSSYHRLLFLSDLIILIYKEKLPSKKQILSKKLFSVAFELEKNLKSSFANVSESNSNCFDENDIQSLEDNFDEIMKICKSGKIDSSVLRHIHHLFSLSASHFFKSSSPVELRKILWSKVAYLMNETLTRSSCRIPLKLFFILTPRVGSKKYSAKIIKLLCSKLSTLKVKHHRKLQFVQLLKNHFEFLSTDKSSTLFSTVCQDIHELIFKIASENRKLFDLQNFKESSMFLDLFKMLKHAKPDPKSELCHFLKKILTSTKNNKISNVIKTLL